MLLFRSLQFGSLSIVDLLNWACFHTSTSLLLVSAVRLYFVLHSFMSDAVMEQMQSLFSLTLIFMLLCGDKLVRAVLIFKSLQLLSACIVVDRGWLTIHGYRGWCLVQFWLLNDDFDQTELWYCISSKQISWLSSL